MFSVGNGVINDPMRLFHFFDKAIAVDLLVDSRVLLAMENAISAKVAAIPTLVYAYETAVDEKYRFFSFGDAMFIE